ncbi:MAG: hypothetical protein HY359_13305 [Candidatus Rokubacteria bacterium]|nr:hypothetical protein [Candidatus Rokubacteria bacterium]
MPLRHRAAAVLLLVLASGCGRGSETTGPDTVPEAERSEHLQTAKARTEEPLHPTPMRVADVIARIEVCCWRDLS